MANIAPNILDCEPVPKFTMTMLSFWWQGEFNPLHTRVKSKAGLIARQRMMVFKAILLSHKLS